MLIQKKCKRERDQRIGWKKGDIFYRTPAGFLFLPREKRPFFALRQLTIGDKEYIGEEMAYSRLSGESVDTMQEILKRCVVNARNYRNNAGKLVQNMSLKQHPRRTREDLYIAISKRSTITEDEKTGLRILAGIHAGNLKDYTCAGCGRTQRLLEARGVTGVYDSDGAFLRCEPKKDGAEWVVFSEEVSNAIIEYHHCPLLFIPSSVMNWYDIYSYWKQHPHAAPNYEDQTLRFSAAVKYYESELNAQQSGKHG